MSNVITEATRQRDPYLIYLDNTFLIDLADSAQKRHSEDRRLVDLFRRNAVSELLKVRTSRWALAEAHSVIYRDCARSAGHTDPSPNASSRSDPRYFLPVHVQSVIKANTIVMSVLMELQEQTDFVLLPVGDISQLGFWPLVQQIVLMGVGFPADSVHLAIALEAGCSLLITDDNDLLRKVDYIADPITKPYWTANFGDSPDTPPLTACGVGVWNNVYPGDGKRPSAIQHLNNLGFT